MATRSDEERTIETWSFTLLAMLSFVTIAALWRWSDLRAEQALWRQLAAAQPATPPTFDASMVAELPEPARRYFCFSIKAGTPLATVAEIHMHGEFSLGSKDAPRYAPMTAKQILAPPHGFVWKVNAGTWLPITGSDAAANGSSWSRFWLAGVVPVARAGGNHDHARAAFGRYIAEGVFWTPAALLPRNGVRWEYVDEATARVVVSHRDLQQAVDVTIDASGQPRKVVFQRWSNANPEKIYRLQPFGGFLSDYRVFDGFRLPTRIEAGNHFGTEDYFPFFKATVGSVNFNSAPSDTFAA